MCADTTCYCWDVEPLTQRALERRLKRYVSKETHDFLAVGAPGFEAVLLAEVEALPGVSDAKIVRGGVEFRGPYRAMYYANLQLASAHRVLWRIANFLAQSYPMLYNKALKVPWERYLGFQPQVKFSVSSRSSRLHYPPKIAETIFSAAQTALSPLGLHPESSDDAVLDVHVRLYQDRCTLSLDTSGEHLHRRGYRTHVGSAPIRETLAAAILETLNFRQFDLIVDPMCGSGTFLLEAARLSRGAAPGGERTFAFEAFPGFQPSLWERLKREAKAREHPASVQLLGFDQDAQILSAAKHNAERAGIVGAVQFSPADALTLPYNTLETGAEHALLVTNPPYGRRLSAKDARQFYADLSATLSRSPGWTFALLTPDPNWVNLNVSKRLEFRNGGVEITLLVGQT